MGDEDNTGEVILLHNKAIRKQVEFYFGEPNYSRDKYLQQFVSAENPSGYVPIVELLKFPRMKVLLKEHQHSTPTESVSTIAASLQNSRVVSVNPNKTMVRRKKRGLGNSSGAVAGAGVSVSAENGGGDSSGDSVMKEAVVGGSVEEQMALEVGEYLTTLPFRFYGLVYIKEIHAHLYESKNIRVDWDTLVTHLKQLPYLVIDKNEKMVRKNDVCVRNWVAAKQQQAETKDHSFSVMTYNILAQCLAAFQFPYASKEVLKWENRLSGIIREIDFYSPDIVCMQELQSIVRRPQDQQVFKITATVQREDDGSAEDHLRFVAQALAASGYTYHYIRKKRHNGPQRKGADIGNAVFWKNSTFTLLDYEQVFIEKVLWEKGPSELEKQLFANGFPQVALFVCLKHVNTRKPLVVATTHICACYQTPYIQLLQVMACLSKLEKYSPAPIILAGDFNSLPQTATYQLLLKGRVSSQDPTMIAMKGLGVKSPFKIMKHDLEFDSAYAAVLGKEPACSNLTHEFVGTLDYIWYTNKLLTPLGVLDIPPVEALTAEVGMPSSKFPSDHLHMLCSLQFT